MVADFTVLCINDKRKLCNNRNTYKQQKQNLFYKLCGRMFTVENGQSNEFISNTVFSNVKVVMALA